MIGAARTKQSPIRVGVKREPLTRQRLLQTVPTSYLVWGFANVGVSLFMTFWPHTVAWSTIARNGIVISGGLWILVGALRLHVPVRLNAGIVLILLLQVWGVVATYWVSATLGRSRPFNFTDFFLLRYAYLFFSTAMLAYVFPKTRKVVMAMVFACVFASAIVAFAQFFGFTSALRLAQYLNPDVNILNWDNRGGVRAIGLYGFPGHLALVSNFACALIAARLVVRPLTKKEIFWFFFFATSSLLPQARSHIPALVLICLFFVIGILIRNRGKAAQAVVAFFALGAAMFLLTGSKLNYLMSTDWLDDPNLQYRKEEAWVQADLVGQRLPWTGIGPEPRYWGRPDIRQDKWAPRTAFDNGWLLIKSSYGVIGVMLVGWALFLGVIAPFPIRKNPRVSDERKWVTAAFALMCMALGIGMYGNNVVTWEPAMVMLFACGGIAMATREEEASYFERRKDPSTEVAQEVA